MKQLKCQMDGLDDNVEELKACVPQWEQDRLVQELKARKVEPAIQIAPKKTLAEQLIKIQVKEDMEEKPKKASNFTSNRSSAGRKKKKALAGQGGGGMSKQGRRQGKTKKIKF